VGRGLLVAILALVLASSAGAGLEPSRLVLGPAEVPAGFVLQPDESGLRTNAQEAKDFPETKDLFRRWKRVTGYAVAYERGSADLEARSDLFRSRVGADALLDMTDREGRVAGVWGQHRSTLSIGDRGIVYWTGGDLRMTLVLWREGRVFAGLQGTRLPRAEVIRLARRMQRGIVAELAKS
jgi:hypothetical protein